MQEALQQPGATRFDWDLLPQPQGKDRATVVTAEGYYIRAGSSQVDLSWALITQLMGREAQQAYLDALSEWPARKDLLAQLQSQPPQGAPKNLAQVINISSRIARVYPMTPNFSKWMFDPATKAFNDAVDGKVSVETAARQAQQTAQQTLSDINKRFPS